MHLTLADSPPLPANVGVVADTGVVVTSVTGAVGGVTAGIVQSGIANALVGMLRCSELDAEAEVDFVSNPGGWAVGRASLQHQRGSLLLVLILMSSVVLVAGCVVCVMYARGDRAGGGGGGGIRAQFRRKCASLVSSSWKSFAKEGLKNSGWT
jgi:hypothetical protein